MYPACPSRAVREAAAAGEVIRLVRRAQGLSQRQLGAATGCSESTILWIERGGPGTRDVATLRQLGSQGPGKVLFRQIDAHRSLNERGDHDLVCSQCAEFDRRAARPA
ncbi:MAG: helix-turn-helix domain-containing protein, partial [Pseudonocardiaceae bacterium]